MDKKTGENIKKETHWVVCQECQGRGRKRNKLRKKTRLNYQRELDEFEKNNGEGLPPTRPKGQLQACSKCDGSGLISSSLPPVIDKKKYPHVAIIGAGIGGVALAVACLHRGIPFTLYERDSSFDARSQGYGLTLQQASKAVKGLGILSLEAGITSTRHVVHTTAGKIIGEWGFRKWGRSETKTVPKRTNIHIARQSLRLALLEQLGGENAVQWGHQLLDYTEKESEGIHLNFQINGNLKKVKADLVVGADGIRSTTRKLLIGEKATPLRYLGCIVILGICSLKKLEDLESPLLDSATVFQTANGKERIYMMPFNAEAVMWQLSLPMLENKAKKLSALGAKALKEEACRTTQWHNPIPQVLSMTEETEISGYPVYDRTLLQSKYLEKEQNITLLGDAAHPMSPFKGQGANQALLDALSLAREIYKSCNSLLDWRKTGLRKNILTAFEKEMLERSAIKVEGSAEAAKNLHSEIVLQEGNESRGKSRNKKEL